MVIDGVSGSLAPPGKQEIRGSNPQPKHVLANCSESCEYERGVKWTCHGDSAFCQISLVFVVVAALVASTVTNTLFVQQYCKVLLLQYIL